MKKLRGNANKLRNRIDERTKELHAEHERRIKGRGEEEYQAALQTMNIEVLPLKKQEEGLREKVAKLEKEAEVVTVETAKEKLINSEIEQMETNVTKLHAALSKLVVEEETDSRVNPVGEAEWQKLSSKKRILLLILAPLMGFVLVALGLAWLESSAHRITTAEEVSAGLSLRVVGTVPILPQPGGKEASAEQGHNLVESIDAIRTMLLRSARNDKTRVVMVTSAVSGEGKTTLASNLAVSLAKVGKKTLLMDCDLRGPAVHQLFEQQLQPGFSEALLGEVPLQDTLRQTNDPNLWILPAGHWDREVVQELAKNGLESMFERLKEAVRLHPRRLAPDPGRQRRAAHRPAGRCRHPFADAGVEPGGHRLPGMSEAGDAWHRGLRHRHQRRAGQGLQTRPQVRRPRAKHGGTKGQRLGFAHETCPYSPLAA